MEDLRIFTVPWLADRMCGGKLVNLMNLRVELQGGVNGVCGVRLGPADALAPIDPTFIQEWFTDKELGARAGALVGGALGSNEERMVMLDGIRIAVQQEQVISTSQFFLIVDGCGRVPDTSPGSSRFW